MEAHTARKKNGVQTLRFEKMEAEELSREQLVEAAGIVARWIYEAELREHTHDGASVEHKRTNGSGMDVATDTEGSAARVVSQKQEGTS